MFAAPVSLDLGSGTFQRLVEEAAGASCSVTFDTPAGSASERAVIWPESRSGVIIRFEQPQQFLPDRVIVTVSACKLTFESAVCRFLSDAEFTLYHPLWAMAPPCSEAETVQAEVRLRYFCPTSREWRSGATVAITGAVFSFVGGATLPVDTELDLRIWVPKLHLPQVVRGRVLGSFVITDGVLIEVVLQACSFQTELALGQSLGLPPGLVPGAPGGGVNRVV